jgi:hypothetical protein
MMLAKPGAPPCGYIRARSLRHIFPKISQIAKISFPNLRSSDATADQQVFRCVSASRQLVWLPIFCHAASVRGKAVVVNKSKSCDAAKFSWGGGDDRGGEGEFRNQCSRRQEKRAIAAAPLSSMSL